MFYNIKNFLIIVFLCIFSSLFVWREYHHKEIIQNDVVDEDKKVTGRTLILDKDHTGTDNAPLNISSYQSNIFPEPPYQEYQQNIIKAEEGDAKAQLTISLILERCSIGSIRNEDQIKYLEESGQIPEEMLKEYKHIYTSCKNIYELLGDSDIDEVRLAWLATAADEISAAKLKLLFEYPSLPSKENVFPVLIASFKELSLSADSRATVFDIANVYYKNFVAKELNIDADNHDPGYFRREPDSLAWEYLACESSRTCDIDTFTDLVRSHYFEHEVDLMIKRSSELRDTIANENWAELGLYP